jgi:hypothetical protein
MSRLYIKRFKDIQCRLINVHSAILQGSAKLEKAEILQMTVEHLKMLHAAGGKGTLYIF